MNDKELDDLLDDALDDFGKEMKIEAPKTQSESVGKVTIEKTQLYVDDIDYDDRPTTTTKTQSKTDAASSNHDQMKLFDEIFANETMKKFTEALNGFKEGDEARLMENFGRVMSELANEDLDFDQDDDEDLDADELAKKLDGLDFFKKLVEPKDSAQKQTTQAEETTTQDDSKKTQMDKILEDMTRNSEKILNDSGSSAAASFSTLFSRLTSSLDDDASGGDATDDLEGTSSMMMEPFLSMLFSKDILYPSLKLMLENYDKYIDERREKMGEDEMKKCLDQKECIGEMCRVYEAMKDEDTKEAKSENLKKILDLLEKCGMPPNELVPEVNPFDMLENQAKPDGCPIS